MKVKSIREKDFIRSALGAMLTVGCGLMLWRTPAGEAWVNASYDYLFRFGARPLPNQAVLIRMDNEAYDHFHQVRGEPWDRALHARLLQRLAADGCALVVFDSFFREPRDPAADEALAEAMRQQHRVVLMAEQAQVTHPTLAGAHPILPAELFLNACGSNWGVAWLDPDLDSIVRRHWPFPAPGAYPSLPWTAARLAGASLSEKPGERWLRYYGRDGAWTTLSYRFALTQPTNYFRGKIVFIGRQPKTSVPGDEDDEFRTPYTRWTGESSGGVEILLTSFLNLLKGDWLRRPAGWLEALGLIVTGTALGGGLCRLRLLTAGLSAAAVVIVVAVGAISWSYFANYWFPWVIVAGGQVSCALAWTVATKIQRASAATPIIISQPPGAKAEAAVPCPEIPDYQLVHPPFGEGAYGKVWLARNAKQKWHALKVIYLANFGDNTDPYEREFNGVTRYQPISDKHPGLLRVEFVSEKLPGYFYYVMELGDAFKPGWEQEPATYKPHDLVNVRAHLPGRRLPVRECLRIGLVLTDALDFLHRQGLTHRDIKPQNIIFVDGQPKLADVGLMAEIRPPDKERTLVGTLGYMPPLPERPGTPQADIYALGMVLYVLATGRNVALFPEIATTLVENREPADFFPLNAVILKACQPDCAERYASAAEMHEGLLAAQQALGKEKPGATFTPGVPPG